MATAHYKITEKELLALIATVETCRSIFGDLEHEVNEAQKAIFSFWDLFCLWE